MSSGKKKMMEIIHSHPDDSTFEEIMHELLFVNTIERWHE